MRAGGRIGSRWRFGGVTGLLGLMVAIGSGATVEQPGVPVSGRVEILDRGGAKRADASNVVVWIEGDGIVPPPVPEGSKPATFWMMSREKKFQPTLLVVPVGSEVAFPNYDPIYHNVFSVSGANRFDLGLYRSGKSKSMRFKTPGLVRVYCNIHSQMVGFVHVMATPFFVVTGSDGRFHFEDVPPGRRLLKAWEERAGDVQQTIVVGRVGATALTIALDARGYVPKPHTNKFGEDYSKGDDDERY